MLRRRSTPPDDWDGALAAWRARTPHPLNPHDAPEAVLAAWADGDNYEQRAFAAICPRTPATALSRIATHDDTLARLLADNPSTNAMTLHAMATSHRYLSMSEARAIAAHPNTSERTLDKLSRRNDDHTPRIIAARPELPGRLARTLAQNTRLDTDTRELAAAALTRALETTLTPETARLAATHLLASTGPYDTDLASALTAMSGHDPASIDLAADLATDLARTGRTERATLGELLACADDIRTRTPHATSTPRTPGTRTPHATCAP